MREGGKLLASSCKLCAGMDFIFSFIKEDFNLPAGRKDAATLQIFVLLRAFHASVIYCLAAIGGSSMFGETYSMYSIMASISSSVNSGKACIM